ncbi:helix-turn-helix domain-containing protein [Hansschlegelia zhihuaiae]|uniref:helix-turn-helix domain-containing protein n=1 Tax=Hansschlegelia zhihuaiae TaxID=405005 RepID=UPI0013E8D1BC|nr:helix-turn-helix domain-containing protein [Hansschlegelia zhihuaiae]
MSGLIPYAGYDRTDTMSRSLRAASEHVNAEQRWTPEKVSELKRLKRERRAYSEIADRLGCTKNAVCGKVHRLGLPPDARNTAPGTSPVLIISLVAQSFGVTAKNILGRDQSRRVSEPRQIAMFLCRRLTKASHRQIAARFDRNQATVGQALLLMRCRFAESADFRKSIRALERSIRERSSPLQTPVEHEKTETVR